MKEKCGVCNQKLNWVQRIWNTEKPLEFIAKCCGILYIFPELKD